MGAARVLSTTLALSLLVNGAGLATPATAAGAAPADRGWPRLYTLGSAEVTLHQPQVEEWQSYSVLLARLAVSVKLKGAKDPVFGVVELKAATATDHANRLVTLYRPEIVAVRFPNVPQENVAALEQAVRSVPPAQDRTEIALDRVLAYLKLADDKKKGVAVNLEPPPIFYSDSEAAVVSFLGEPRFTKIEGSPLEFGLNTNWDVFHEPGGAYFLLYRSGWLTAPDLAKGPWAATTKLPSDLKKLPKDSWERVLKSIPGEKLKTVPKIYVSNQPSEVILTSGRPKFEAIPGTRLASVANSQSTLFFHTQESNFYFLAAGRWFRAASLNGPWRAATTSLPEDFAKIPKKHPKAYVLSSVPGTQEAEDAVYLASIPKTGIVNRAEAKAVVSYDGEPKFEPIEKTSVEYAVNTPNDVFKVGSSYYCCYEAVWFTASAPSGPWVVATNVPKEIYAIPPTSPKYNVTYVTVVESTPTTVTCAHTSGYSGEVVASGVVMFGIGMAVGAMVSGPYHYGYYPPFYWGYGYPYPPYYGHGHVYASPNGYGWSAHGPYGGAGYGARYNPSTGIYSRGGYAYGPGGGGAWRTGYNPSTGAWGGQRGGYNAYGSWKQTSVARGDDWARGGRVSNSQGTAGGFRTSSGAAGVGYRGNQGSGYVVKGQGGDIYAGRDGNVYRRDDSGNWSSAGGPKVSPTTAGESGGRGSSAATRDRSAGVSPSTRDSLNSDHSARTGGNARASSNSSFGGRSFSGSGGGGRRGGGGGRRR